MKKILNTIFLATFLFAAACSDGYDDTRIKKDLDDVGQILDELEQAVDGLRTQMDALTQLINSLFVSLISTDAEGNYVITYIDRGGESRTLTLATQKEVVTLPIVGIAKDEDGVWYWRQTSDNGETYEWILVDGEKVPAGGEKPEVGIDAEGFWTVNGKPITDAKGNKVLADDVSNILFKEAYVDEKTGEAVFILADGTELRLQMDGTYHAYLMIPADGYRAQVTAGWMALLVNAGEGIDVDLFLERQPKERMMQKIGQQIRINRSKIKDTSDTNSDFDGLSNAIRSGYYLKDGLANNEDFYYAAILVTVTAASVKDLEWRIEEIRKLMVSQDMNLQLCSFRQEAAFLSSLPLCASDAALFKKYRRNILTSTAASFYPFVSFELCDTNGVLLGVNKYNNSLVSLDNFNTRIYKNANMAILGTSGAGKTFTMQLIARRMRLAGTPVYIIAPLKGHEFYRQAKALNGTIIRIVPGSPDCINVMEIRKIDHTSSELLDGPMPEQSELAAKIQKLHIFFSLLIPDLSNEERQLLDEAIVTTYRNKGITYDNASLDDPAHPGQYREMPILGDLHTVLSAAPETRRIANILNRLVHGSASSFNRQTNVNLDNSYVVIDISELSGDLLTVGMYIGLDYMWDKAKEDLTRRKQIFIDEVWQIIGASSNALAANYVFEAVKTIRGYGGGVLVATQDLNDFFSLEDGKYGRGILNNCKIKIILNLEEEEAQRVQSVLKLTDAEIDNITRFERGSALIVTNSNNVTVDMRCSEEEKDLITTDRDELRRIVERKMQNQPETEES